MNKYENELSGWREALTQIEELLVQAEALSQTSPSVKHRGTTAGLRLAATAVQKNVRKQMEYMATEPNLRRQDYTQVTLNVVGNGTALISREVIRILGLTHDHRWVRLFGSPDGSLILTRAEGHETNAKRVLLRKNPPTVSFDRKIKPKQGIYEGTPLVTSEGEQSGIRFYWVEPPVKDEGSTPD